MLETRGVGIWSTYATNGVHSCGIRALGKASQPRASVDHSITSIFQIGWERIEVVLEGRNWRVSLRRNPLIDLFCVCEKLSGKLR
jgi:hypothetical protein